MMSKKLLISNLVDRTSQLADAIYQQLVGINPKFEERIFIGYLTRHVTVLPEIASILQKNSEQELTSVYILFRCLLDDFITLLHFKFNGYKRELLINHTASGFNHKFQTLQYSMIVNYKYYDGKMPGM